MDDDSPQAPANKGSLRTGFTTGACAAAAAKAAVLALWRQQPMGEVEIALPIGRRVSFPLHRCDVAPPEATCAVIKDGGDDPDATHGAEICATVSWRDGPGIALERGVGVGVVTKPGLGLEIGGPAINPVPRRMIAASVREGLAETDADPERGVRVVIWVPDGEERAKKTLNGRLGIVGGISILGTTGIVVPFSTSAYKASIVKAMDVARAVGCHHAVLTTGGRSEAYAQALHSGLPMEAFIQIGEFLGFALKLAAVKGFERVTMAGMIGKLSKVAAGHMMLHVHSSEVDVAFLARLAAECGASPETVAVIGRANTARHAAEIAAAHGVAGLFDSICALACRQSRRQIGDRLPVEILLFDFDGPLLGRAAGGVVIGGQGIHHRHR